MQAQPFRIHVADAVLDDLRARLSRSRWTRVTQDSGWESGTNIAYLRELVYHWQTRYDWRAHEAELNRLPHFKADAGGGRLHFVHLKARGGESAPLPLLLLHGWPDSFYRYHQVIAPLGARFDLVIPSLPGFAFTGLLRRSGQEPPNRFTARLLWQLMTGVLGYRRFAVAGGDGGSVIAQILAIEHPEAVVGIHLTDLGWHALNVDPASASRSERKYLEAVHKQQLSDGAYALVQMTQPRSLAAGLNDSPVGLASWIVDRFAAWSDCGGDLDRSFSKDDLLTNIMLYWLTDTIGSSVFNYHAEIRAPSLTTADRVSVPVGLALFPKEPGGLPPRGLAERTLNVQRWTEMPRGGHFAAWEEPKLYADDLIRFLQSLGDVDPRSAPGPTRDDDSHVASSTV